MASRNQNRAPRSPFSVSENKRTKIFSFDFVCLIRWEMILLFWVQNGRKMYEMTFGVWLKIDGHVGLCK